MNDFLYQELLNEEYRREQIATAKKFNQLTKKIVLFFKK